MGSLDYVVLGVYFVAVLGVGLWFGRSERNTEDYFLGGRSQHWLIVGLSILATEVSALTFVAVPADSFAGDWNYLQLYAGSFLGRILILYLLLPAFYAHRVTTVYEYLGHRFGPGTRTTASLIFFASRIVGSGIRLLAASIAIALVFHWPLTWVIVGSAAVAVAYTTFGGIKAIIWTDALQAIVFLAGGLTAAVWLLAHGSGGWLEQLGAAKGAGKLHVFTFSGGLNSDRLFWVLLISTTFTNMAALGTDQDLTQRMLTCPDLRKGQRSLLFNAFAGFTVVCLFLLIGTLLAGYYARPGAAPLPDAVTANPRGIFPHFIATAIPAGLGLRGLLAAGIFAAALSSLDSALGAMSSTAVTDFYKPWLMRKRRAAFGAQDASKQNSAQHEAHLLKMARLFSICFGVLLVAVALAFAGAEGLLWVALKWAGLLFGAMLGVFLLGVLTKDRGRDGVNVCGMLSSVAILVAIKLYQQSTGTTLIAWPWWIVIGTTWTFMVGLTARSASNTLPAPREGLGEGRTNA